MVELRAWGSESDIHLGREHDVHDLLESGFSAQGSRTGRCLSG